MTVDLESGFLSTSVFKCAKEKHCMKMRRAVKKAKESHSVTTNLPKQNLRRGKFQKTAVVNYKLAERP